MPETPCPELSKTLFVKRKRHDNASLRRTYSPQKMWIAFILGYGFLKMKYFLYDLMVIFWATATWSGELSVRMVILKKIK